MISIAKWTVILLVAVYLAGLLVLYVRQREMLFPYRLPSEPLLMRRVGPRRRSMS